MYSFLLKNKIVNSLLLVALLIALRVVHFFDAIDPYDGTYGLLYREWFTDPPMGEWFWVTLLLLFQMYCVLLIFLQLKISTESTLVPGLVFVLFSALIPAFGTFHPIIFANTMLLIATQQLLSISPRETSGKKVFNVGVFVALATLFYGAYVLFLVAAISGINIIRSFKSRDIKILFLGFLAPFFLLGVYYFWFDKLPYFFQSIFDGIGIIGFRYLNDYWHIGVVSVVGLLILTLVLNGGQVMTKKTNTKQNYFKIAYWFLFACLLSTLIQKQIGIEHLLILAIPISFLFSEFLVNWKEMKAKLIMNIILTLIILYQYKHLFL